MLAGPDDAELTPRELALLEAHLKQPIRFSSIQQERRATGESETCNRRNKLTLIRDFNRNLQAALGDTGNSAQKRDPVQGIDEGSSDAKGDKCFDGGEPAADNGGKAKPKRRGRKKADYATIQKEAALAADWTRVRDAGVYKCDFARQRGMKVKALDALLDRVGKRNRTSE